MGATDLLRLTNPAADRLVDAIYQVDLANYASLRDALMQIGIAGVPPRTEDMLDFIVVGGGVTGLATAWSLQKVGHRVTLFEQQDHHVMSQCREGIRSPPSMTKILNDWGIGVKLSEISTVIEQITFLDGKTGANLGLIGLSGKVMEFFAADSICVQYGELFTVFYDLAQQAGVDLHYNTEVISIDPWKASITCEGCRQWTADVIVGADGVQSMVRPVVLDPYTPESDCDNRFTVNLVVPSDVLRQDQELEPLLHSKSWTAWLADNCAMHGALAGPGPNHHYALVMYLPIHNPDDLEESPLSLESLGFDLFERRAQKLLKHSEQLRNIVFTHYDPFDNWVHESGKVVLVGEAAHPVIPSGAHNIAPGIEDALTLSVLFSLPASKPQTPMLLNVYEELRQPRCATVQRYFRHKRDILMMSPGLAQRRRDELLRSQRDCYQEEEQDDEFLSNTYSGFLQVYGFDAREALQDWWVQWGRSMSSHPPKSESKAMGRDEKDRPNLVPIIIDAEVEREGPSYPTLSDPIIGDDEAVTRASDRRRADDG